MTDEKRVVGLRWVGGAANPTIAMKMKKVELTNRHTD